MEEPGGLLAMELHDCSDLAAAAAACIHMFKSSDDTLIQHLEIGESLCKHGISSWSKYRVHLSLWWKIFLKYIVLLQSMVRWWWSMLHRAITCILTFRGELHTSSVNTDYHAVPWDFHWFQYYLGQVVLDCFFNSPPSKHLATRIHTALTKLNP